MCQIVRDKKSKKSKGYGFASFSEQVRVSPRPWHTVRWRLV